MTPSNVLLSSGRVVANSEMTHEKTPESENVALAQDKY